LAQMTFYCWKLFFPKFAEFFFTKIRNEMLFFVTLARFTSSRVSAGNARRKYSKYLVKKFEHELFLIETLYSLKFIGTFAFYSIVKDPFTERKGSIRLTSAIR
jgi:hypothetical protein